MTPKEKAEQIVAKYGRILPMNQTTMMDYKNCALIAVDEILHSLEYKSTHNHEELRFYEEVKQEIENL